MFNLPALNLFNSITGPGAAVRQPVRVATTTSGTLATSFANGQSVDGLSLVTNNRILIKNQVTASENGIYVVQSAGAPIRATDTDTGSSISGITIRVQSGTVNGGRGFVCTNAAGSDVVGTNSLTFVVYTLTSASSVFDRGIAIYSGTSGNVLQSSALQISAGGSLQDNNAKTILGFVFAGASTANNIEITNAVTGNFPNLSVVGTDTDINLIIKAKGTGVIGVASTGGVASGELRLFSPTLADYVSLKAPTSPLSYKLTLPTGQGAANHSLLNDGSGNLSWAPMNVVTEISATTVASTSSTTFVTITSMTTSATTGTYQVTFSGSFSLANTLNVTFSIALFLDGTIITHTQRDMWNINSQARSVIMPCHTQAVITVSGTQTIDVRYKASSSNLISITNRTMHIWRLS